MIYEIIMSSPSKALCECRLQEWEKVWACKQADWDTEKKKHIHSVLQWYISIHKIS